MTGVILPESLRLEERATPSTPTTSESMIYPKSDGLWYSKDASGVERSLDGVAALRDFQSQVSITGVKEIDFGMNQLANITGKRYALRAAPGLQARRIDGAIAAYSGTPNMLKFDSGSTYSGGSASAIVNSRLMAQFTTAASVNANASMSLTTQARKPNNRYLTYFCTRISTGSSVSSIRITIGLSTTTPITSDTPGSTTAALIRYSTAIPDSGWVGVLVKSDGTVGATSSLGAIATSTDYVFEIFVRGSTTYFALNYGTPVALSSPDISAESLLGTPQMTVQTLDGNAKTLYIAGFMVADYEL